MSTIRPSPSSWPAAGPCRDVAPSPEACAEELRAMPPDARAFGANFGARISMPRWVLSAERSVRKGVAGRGLFTATWHPIDRDAPKGTVVVFQGRGESAYRWEEPARVFTRSLGQRVISADWPGQGFSGRNAPENAHHYDSFDTLVDEGVALLEGLERDGELVRPVTLLGHSMGGLVAAQVAVRFAEREREDDAPPPVDRLVLSAMMSGFHPDLVASQLPSWMTPLLERGPEPHQLLGALASAKLAVGSVLDRDWRFDFAPGAQATLERVLGRGPTSIDDPRRHRRVLKATSLLPSAHVGGPTWGFLNAAAEAMDALREDASKIALPTLVISAERDETVDNASHEAVARSIPGSEHVVIADAAHSPHQGGKRQRRDFYEHLARFMCP